jgi:hypothetical protein
MARNLRQTINPVPSVYIEEMNNLSVEVGKNGQRNGGYGFYLFLKK